MNKLDELIPQYAENKNELDSYKKICDRENAQIKELMAKLPDKSYEAGGYRATYSVSKRENFREDDLISLFTSVPSFTGIADKYSIVKTKPYIDFDALEKALYDEALSNEQMLDLDKARETKDVVTLRITKIKKKEN